MNLEITIYDGFGNVVEHSIWPCQVASQAEIDDMVMMIDAGTPAYLAAILAKQHQE